MTAENTRGRGVVVSDVDAARVAQPAESSRVTQSQGPKLENEKAQVGGNATRGAEPASEKAVAQRQTPNPAAAVLANVTIRAFVPSPEPTVQRAPKSPADEARPAPDERARPSGAPA